MHILALGTSIKSFLYGLYHRKNNVNIFKQYRWTTNMSLIVILVREKIIHKIQFHIGDIDHLLFLTLIPGKPYTDECANKCIYYSDMLSQEVCFSGKRQFLLHSRVCDAATCLSFPTGKSFLFSYPPSPNKIMSNISPDNCSHFIEKLESDSNPADIWYRWLSSEQIHFVSHFLYIIITIMIAHLFASLSQL